MKYVQPYDQPSNPTAPYVDLNAGAGVDGSIPPAKFFNNTQTEIINVITAAGLTPSDSDLTQLLEAIRALMPTPTGAPSDASLVHFALDTGAANALVFTPSPAAAGISAGFTIIGVFAANNTGAATVTYNLSGGSSVTKSLVRDDASALQANDVVGGRLGAIVYDGAHARLAWLQRGVLTDGSTVLGDGLATPLSSPASPSGPGVSPDQFVTQYMHCGLLTPAQYGFVPGVTTTSGANLQAGTVVAPGSAAPIYELPINVTGVPAIAGFGAGAGPWSAIAGTLTGSWQCVGWDMHSSWGGGYGYAFKVYWKRYL